MCLWMMVILILGVDVRICGFVLWKLTLVCQRRRSMSCRLKVCHRQFLNDSSNPSNSSEPVAREDIIGQAAVFLQWCRPTTYEHLNEIPLQHNASGRATSPKIMMSIGAPTPTTPTLLLGGYCGVGGSVSRGRPASHPRGYDMA